MIINIPPNAGWRSNATTIAGGNGFGNGISQLSGPRGLYVDEDQTVYVADQFNHRIMEWKWGKRNGRIVAGGNGQGNGAHQLDRPYSVVVDERQDSLIICSWGNNRIVRWARQNSTAGETMLPNIYCGGLAMDENDFLYVADWFQHAIRRYRPGDTKGMVIAGGNGQGNRLDQFSNPWFIFVDRDHSIYVSDRSNHRVMKWSADAKQGVVVAGGHGQGSNLTQFFSPLGVVVDPWGTVYVADRGNDRVMGWPKGSMHGSIVVGGNLRGRQLNQFSDPWGVSFDRHGNLYVVDYGNHRIQRFNIDRKN